MATRSRDAALENLIESLFRNLSTRLRRELEGQFEALRRQMRSQHSRAAKGRRTASPQPARGASLSPLPEMQDLVWQTLHSRRLLAKEVSQAVYGTPTSAAVVRKHIGQIRKSGREIKFRAGFGYYRPDAPPPSEAPPVSSGSSIPVVVNRSSAAGRRRVEGPLP